MRLAWIGILGLALATLLAPAQAAPRQDDDAQCRRYTEDAAIPACDRLISGGKKDAKTQSTWHLFRCAARNHRGDSQAALADCDESIRRDPASHYAYETRCWVWNTLRERDKAVSDCSKSISLNARYNRPYTGRCVAYAHRGEIDKALRDCNEAIRLDPKWAPAYEARCWVRQRHKAITEALSDCTESIRLAPRAVPGYVTRCETHNLNNDPDRAIADCNEALKLGPRSFVALNLRCWSHYLKRDADAAIRDCDEAIRLNDRFVYAYNNRGNAFRLKGDNARALADYNQAIKIDPGFHHPYVNRGLILESQGALAAALADFRLLVSIDPDGEAARTRVARVEKRIASLAASPAAPAATKRIALVIGNSAYQKVGRLNNAQNDAEAIATAFRKLGFATVLVRQDLSREQFVDALKGFAELAAGAEWAVIYYAGHGIEVNGTNYVIPTNATLASDTQVPFEAIPLDQLLLSVEGAGKLRLVMLDACRENPFIAGMKRNSATRSIGRGLAKVEPDSATLVVYAAKAGAIAQDGKGRHGPFAEAFVKHVDTPGLEINLLFRKVRDEVLRMTERRQEPYVYGSLPAEELFFRPN